MRGGHRFQRGSRGSIQIGPRGFKMRSKAEVAYAHELEAKLRAGEIAEWHYAPSLGCGIKEDGTQPRYSPDFLIIHHDGVAEWIDVKGRGNPQDSNKAKRDALRLRAIDVRIERR